VEALSPECEQEIEDIFKKAHMTSDDHSSEFVIEFERVWKWLGYTEKAIATQFLTSVAEENVDFCTSTL
jgi:hypothetical protein